MKYDPFILNCVWMLDFEWKEIKVGKLQLFNLIGILDGVMFAIPSMGFFLL